MENKINYIVDEFGNTTHAIIPIAEWDSIQNEKNGLKSISYQVDTSLPLSHVNNVLHLLRKAMIEEVDPVEWRREYESFFSYFKLLTAKDIALLFIIRNDLFNIKVVDDYANASDDQILSLKKSIKKLKEIWYITKKSGDQISTDDYKNLQNKIATSSELEFITYFNDDFLFAQPLDIGMKLKRGAERDRLFIFDIFHIFSSHRKYFQEFDDLYDEDAIEESYQRLFNSISLYLYKGGKNGNTRTHRAIREAYGRIHLNEWKKYIKLPDGESFEPCPDYLRTTRDMIKDFLT